MKILERENCKCKNILFIQFLSAYSTVRKNNKKGKLTDILKLREEKQQKRKVNGYFEIARGLKNTSNTQIIFTLS